MISADARFTLRSVAWAAVQSVDIIRTGVTRPGGNYHSFLAGTVRADLCHARVMMSGLRQSTPPAQWPEIIAALRVELIDVRRVVASQPLRRCA